MLGAEHGSGYLMLSAKRYSCDCRHNMYTNRLVVHQSVSDDVGCNSCEADTYHENGESVQKDSHALFVCVYRLGHGGCLRSSAQGRG